MNPKEWIPRIFWGEGKKPWKDFMKSLEGNYRGNKIKNLFAKIKYLTGNKNQNLTKNFGWKKRGAQSEKF